MTRLIHLSDLHFGLERRELTNSLIMAINDCSADLVVCTGDLVHRARHDAFFAARNLFDAIKAPIVTVPGNHDIPLYNLPLRLTRPFADMLDLFPSSREWVSRTNGVCVIGMNTTDHVSWQRGRISIRQLNRSCQIASKAHMEGDTVIVALHHPLEHHPSVDKELTVNAAYALDQFQANGVDVVLSGHLHRWFMEYFIKKSDRRLLQIQGGTALCDRSTDLQNEFAVFDFGNTDLTITRFIASRDEMSFRPQSPISLFRQDGVWHVQEQVNDADKCSKPPHLHGDSGLQ